MAQINLLRNSVTQDPLLQGYHMTLEVSSTEDITSKVFVNQRLRNYSTQEFDDVFVAVATPAQIEDFAEDAPAEGTSYFRTASIDILSRNADYLDEVFTDITNQLQKLINDTESLEVLNTDGTYQITSNDIEIV